MKSIIPFLDLKAQYLSIKKEIDDAVIKVLESSKYVLGPEVEKFEKEFATFHNAKHGVAVNSGTSALHLALLAAGVGHGDEVITVSMSFIATATAISYIGATPVFVDINPITFTIDTSKIVEKITKRTKAIIPVHLYGLSADMKPIMKIAEHYGLVVIEDAAQAHGAEYFGKKVGSIGHMAAFSFYPGKNLGAYGEGGIVTTNNNVYSNYIRLLRDWGQKKKYQHDILAYNYRMDAIQGSILRVKLRYLNLWTKLRRSHAKKYESYFSKHKIPRSTESTGLKHVYHIYSVFHAARQKLQNLLTNKGIQTGMHYPTPIHMQKPYRSLGYQGHLPITEKIAKEQLSLPMFAELTNDQVTKVSKVVELFFKKNNTNS